MIKSVILNNRDLQPPALDARQPELCHEKGKGWEDFN